MATEQDRPVGIRELARELNLPVTWLRAEADAGRLPCLRAGRRLLFCPAAVTKALARRAAGTAEPDEGDVE